MYSFLLKKLYICNKNYRMFWIFKKKSEKEKLHKLYMQKEEEAYILSTKNRSESDRLKKEADDILKKINNLDK